MAGNRILSVSELELKSNELSYLKEKNSRQYDIQDPEWSLNIVLYLLRFKVKKKQKMNKDYAV